MLDEAAIARALGTLPLWERRGETFERRFDCKNFDGSIRFVNAVAVVANKHDHHPDITISWNEVTLSLTSHDVRGLTSRDVRLAGAIDRMPEE